MSDVAPAVPDSARTILRAAAGVVDRDGGREFVMNPWWALDEDGNIVALGAGPSPNDDAVLTRDLGHSLVLPGLVNAHSHAFQRSIRGRTHRRGAHDPSSFWSWRTQMYEAANTLDPAQFFQVTKACFQEMLDAGITCVGEFHYVHHDVDGTPYDDPNLLSKQVLAAAEEVGIRVVLLEVLYLASGFDAAPLPEQRRFCDGDVDHYLRRCEALMSARSDRVFMGLAPHSVRAVPRAALASVASFAATNDLIVHAHVSEQVAENEACVAAHGCSPVALLAESGLLERPGSFTAVHAIHIDADDRARLAGHTVCACPTTEADLGDGTVIGSALQDAGVHLALGSDSNSIIDLITEARSLELHERLATQRRLCLAQADRPISRVLLDAATTGGARALGVPHLGRLAVGGPFDAVVFDLDHPTLCDVDDADALDAIMLAGSRAPVRAVFTGGAQRG
ncbi:MAG: formimidoylglutamate deiminase [Nannocystaceae bacterium]